MSRNDPAGPEEIHPFLAAFKTSERRNVGHVCRDTGGPVAAGQAGVFLVHPARHCARRFVQTGVLRNEDEALDRIRRLFGAEWDSTTDLGEGGIPS